MSWDQETFLARLKQAVDSYDGEAAAALCQELVDGLAAGAELQPGLGREALALLRRKRYFELMERVAGELVARATAVALDRIEAPVREERDQLGVKLAFDALGLRCKRRVHL